MAFLTLGFSLGGSSSPAPAAPSGLTVAIAEASLAFGDTATMVIAYADPQPYPTPEVVVTWTLDTVDVEGQTGLTFEGVPVGALRAVVVSAANSEGSAGPVTSDPVTVVALAPGAFSPGQWSADATGASGEVAVTLFGLPPANGAAITSVERQVDAGAWTALASLEIGVAQTISGLTDDQLYSFKLRAINAVDIGPVSDTKTETPFAVASAPAVLDASEFSFESVPASDDLELNLLRALTDETAIGFEIDTAVKPEATFAALASGPVALDVPTVSGTLELGQTLTANGGRWLSNTGVTGSAWRWLRNGTAISGAVAATYVLVSADGGTNVTAEETATDAQGSTISVSAAAAVPAFGVAPDVTAASFSGTAVTGNTQTAAYTEATGDPAPTISYVWERVGTPIGGAIASTYVPVLAGNHTVVVTATNTAGSDSLESSATYISPALFHATTAVGALKNANALDVGNGGWFNNSSTTATEQSALGHFARPQEVIVSTADVFRGRNVSLGTLTSSVTYRVAAIVAPGVNGACRLDVFAGANEIRLSTTDFTSLTETSTATPPGAFANAVIEDAGDGLTRIRVDYTPDATATHTFRVGPFSTGAGSSVFLYGGGAAEVS